MGDLPEINMEMDVQFTGKNVELSCPFCKGICIIDVDSKKSKVFPCPLCGGVVSLQTQILMSLTKPNVDEILKGVFNEILGKESITQQDALDIVLKYAGRGAKVGSKVIEPEKEPKVKKKKV